MIRGPIGVAAVVLAAAIVWALLVPGADWLARDDISSAKGSLATARGRLLTLGAGLLAAGALLFTARNFTLSREGQVTTRAAGESASAGDARQIPAEGSAIAVGSSMKRNSSSTLLSKARQAWEGSPRYPAVVAPSRSIT